MGKAFSTREREEIQELLMSRGAELFGVMGVRKTTVRDLTDAAGIAKGSFYLFFDSKEELFFKIFRREEKKLKQSLLSQMENTSEITRKRLVHFFRGALREVRQNKIIQRIYSGPDYHQLLRKLPQEMLDQHTEEDVFSLGSLIMRWQRSENFTQAEPHIIVSAIRALFLLPLHEKEIGSEYYSDTSEFWIRALANMMIPGGDHRDSGQ